jgi:hypothetical protein
MQTWTPESDFGPRPGGARFSMEELLVRSRALDLRDSRKQGKPDPVEPLMPAGVSLPVSDAWLYRCGAFQHPASVEQHRYIAVVTHHHERA